MSDTPKTAYVLHRVSTKKQVEQTENQEPDIPLQRRECRRFAETMGWTIIREEQEAGISGYKVSAEKRDVLHSFKKDAEDRLFDILLVFKMDRLGRISSETPFLVEWFVNYGIEVWSALEGQQRLEHHIDKLTNYIRFWQAEGESINTGERVSAKLRQLVEDGHFKGGTPAYGYELIQTDRTNRKGYPTHDLAINESEAAVVRLMYDCAMEGYGQLALSKYLSERNIMSRQDEPFSPSTVARILKNPLYYGILTCGNTKSPTQAHLQIVSKETFDKVQAVRRGRRPQWDEEKRRNPISMRGKALLSGKLFCGHCGGKMALTSTHYHGYGKNKASYLQYTCYNKNRRLMECDGQTTYAVEKLDKALTQIISQVFLRSVTVDTNSILTQHCESKAEELQLYIRTTKSELSNANTRLKTYQSEVIKAIDGTSVFSAEDLNALLNAEKDAILKKHDALIDAEQQLSQINSNLDFSKEQSDSFICLSEVFEIADIRTKKLVVDCIIDRIDIRRGYDVSICCY